MTRRTPTLLEFGIAASVAVVPVLLGVLLLVAWLRPLAEPKTTTPEGERHVSARQVAALKTFERAIVRRDLVTPGPRDASALLAGIPACRAEWEGRHGTLARVRRWLLPGTDAVASPAERLAAQLAGLDEALAAFSTSPNSRVSAPVGFDLVRWTHAVQEVLREPAESPEYPGRKFDVQCADIAGAVATLTRTNARMLSALAWRGTVVPRVAARWRPDQFLEISSRHVARSNPWGGLPGCVYLGHDDAAGPTHFVAETRGIAERLCLEPQTSGRRQDDSLALTGITGEPVADMAPDDERWQVPPSLSGMLRALDPLHRSTAARQEPNRVPVGNTLVDVGYSVDVTIVPGTQALAQRVAACYTGRQDVCRALGIVRKEDADLPIGHQLLEEAMVRMAAVAIIDVGSGRIEALAGALSPCTRQEYDGPGRARECDARMPYPIRYRPDALLNPAVFHDAMPASVVKPIMAAAFLSDPEVGKRWLADERAQMQRTPWPARDSLRGQLMRSDSARFLDRMFCADRKFAQCTRAWEVQAAAAAFGWNAECAAPAEDCGKRELLFGGAAPAPGMAAFAGAPAMRVPFGRLMVEPMGDAPGAPIQLRRRAPFDTGTVAACAAGPDGRRQTRDDWERCRARTIVDVAAEGWGQGNARASPLGVAGMMATLAAAANGAIAHAPHLVQAIRSVTTTWTTPDATSDATGRLTQDIAEVVLSGLSYSHRAGTARLACEQVFDARTCREMDWIAGKTGTPTFPNDDVSLNELARLCVAGVARTRAEFATCGALRPYKWYAAAYRADPFDPKWTKAIAVLVERNWLAGSGRIHGAGDHGPNPAAEIALQIAGRHVGKLKGAAP
jgi:hypothetical protein